MHAMRGRDLGEISVRATVDVGHRDDVRARGEGLEDIRRGGRAGRKGQRIFRVLEGRNSLLKVVPSRRLGPGTQQPFYPNLAPRDLHHSPIGVGAAGVLINADRVADARLRVGGGERNLEILVNTATDEERGLNRKEGD